MSNPGPTPSDQSENRALIDGPDKVAGSGKRDAEKVSSDRSFLPPEDQKAYLTMDPARGPTPSKARQRQAARSTGVRDPETEETAETRPRPAK